MTVQLRLQLALPQREAHAPPGAGMRCGATCVISQGRAGAHVVVKRTRLYRHLELHQPQSHSAFLERGERGSRESVTILSVRDTDFTTECGRGERSVP